MKILFDEDSTKKFLKGISKNRKLFKQFYKKELC